MTNLDSIVKSGDITLPTKVHLVKAMVFPIVTYGCELGYKESWVLKNWCFLIVVLEKTLESPLDCKEIIPVNTKGNPLGFPECSLKGLILKLQYFGHLIRRADSLEKTLMLGMTEAGGEGGDRGWDVWVASPTGQTWVWVNSMSWW